VAEGSADNLLLAGLGLALLGAATLRRRSL